MKNTAGKKRLRNSISTEIIQKVIIKITVMTRSLINLSVNTLLVMVSALVRQDLGLYRDMGRVSQ